MHDVQHLAGGESTRFAVIGSIAEIAFRQHLNSETIAKKRGTFYAGHASGWKTRCATDRG